MKVLVQYWLVWRGSEVISLSKDQAQLDETIARVQREHIETGIENASDPDGEAEWITIPDNSNFADVIENETIFLEDDEKNVVWDSPEYKARFDAIRRK